MGNGPIAADDLRLGIERIERLEEEKKGIADDIKDVYGEYKAKGFCTKTMREIVKLRKMKPDDRREREAMLDIYKGALGMLDGTPLGRWAQDKLEKDAAPEEPEADSSQPSETASESAEDAPKDPLADVSIDDARDMGKAAALDNVPVTANPFPARDPRRAAWDEAWCHALGSDGMDIPDALKPKPKDKKGEPGEQGDDATGNGAAGDEGDA